MRMSASIFCLRPCRLTATCSSDGALHPCGAWRGSVSPHSAVARSAAPVPVWRMGALSLFLQSTNLIIQFYKSIGMRKSVIWQALLVLAFVMVSAASAWADGLTPKLDEKKGKWGYVDASGESILWTCMAVDRKW